MPGIIDPLAEIEKLFSPERFRLVRLIESNLFYLAKEIETPEQAKVVREMFQRPLGVLNSRFGLNTNSANSLQRAQYEQNRSDHSPTKTLIP